MIYFSFEGQLNNSEFCFEIAQISVISTYRKENVPIESLILKIHSKRLLKN